MTKPDALRLLGRRELLKLLGTSAVGVSAAGTGITALLPRGTDAIAGALPDCIVRPQQIEGPFFVDELLDRSDIRSDPDTGEVKPGAPLALTFVVSRIDGDACTPFPNVIVDVWHADAAGTYSDAVDPGFDTRGQQFLRGYQLTGTDGVADFTTIYPGWYAGRAVHIHFKLRTALADGVGLEFTSQLYFDDAVSDTVLAAAPYAAKGTRTVRNANDAFYAGGGSALLLAVSSDGAGGYRATFTIGVEAAATCDAIAPCLAEVQAALPDPAGASDRPSKRTALRLRRRAARIARALQRATTLSGPRRTRQLARARDGLEILRRIARTADRAGSLGVDLGPLQIAIGRLLGEIPA